MTPAVLLREGYDLDELLDEGFRVEGSGWKQRQGTAVADNPHIGRFYRKFAAWAAERGWLRTSAISPTCAPCGSVATSAPLRVTLSWPESTM